MGRADLRAVEARNTLVVDIGGTGMKAAVQDLRGKRISERVRVETPHPCDPALLVETLLQLVAKLPAYDRISVGFPGVVRNGQVRTAPHLGTEVFAGCDLEGAIAAALGKPVRVINDADLHGLGAIAGKGVEVLATLGTGFGTAIFVDGKLGPHLEIAHIPFRKGETYDQHLGNAALERLGKKKWSKRVRKAIDVLRTLTQFDHLYLGGGNAKKLRLELPADVTVIDNSAAFAGGVRLWE